MKRVHFIGKAAVGKSTLINALINDGVGPLPQGGVGPLTAVPIEVEWAAEPFFEATYRSLRDVQEMQARLLQDASQSEEVRRVRHLFLGSPYGPVDPLALGQRIADTLKGRQSRRRSGQLPVDLLKAFLCVAQEEKYLVHRGSTPAHFSADLCAHATGPVSSLVAGLRVGWNSELLTAGVSLVDLPGLGVANDAFQATTKRSLKQARHVVLVVDHRGLDDASLHALRASGFLKRLAEQKTNADAFLTIAVLQLDQIASDRCRQEPSKSWEAHLATSVREVIACIRGQLSELERSETDIEIGPASGGMVYALPVFPREHQRISAGDADDRPRLNKPEQTNIPRLRELLVREAAGQELERCGT